jgi:hypothetical protein
MINELEFITELTGFGKEYSQYLLSTGTSNSPEMMKDLKKGKRNIVEALTILAARNNPSGEFYNLFSIPVKYKPSMTPNQILELQQKNVQYLLVRRYKPEQIS